MSELGDLATSIWDNEFGDATGASQRTNEINSISGWLAGNIGLLNTLIYKSFSGDANGDVCPVGTFKLEEQDIYSQIYLKHFYEKKARNVLRGIDGSLNSDIDWIRLREGDSLIVRNNKTDVSKLYLSMAKDAAEELKDLVYYYNSYQAAPRQVAGNDGNHFVSGTQ
jgi:subtilase family serine protease